MGCNLKYLKILLLLFMAVFDVQATQEVEQCFQFGETNIYIRLVRSRKLGYQIIKGNETLQTVTFDNFETSSDLQNTKQNTYTLSNGDNTIDFELITNTSTYITHVKVSRTKFNRLSQAMDCVKLGIEQTHWYGGPEDSQQYWPIERQRFSNYSYVTKDENHTGIAERYWLNSKGVFLYVEKDTPLFIEQNSKNYENQLCFKAINSLPYNVRVAELKFVYHIVIGRNAKEAHMYAVKNFFGYPIGHPDERMVQLPIWSTWALYKTAINDEVVRDFGNQIINHGFPNSQLEIDDDWEECYGALTFNKSKFPNIKKLTDDLKEQGFRITLWIHPFINKDCIEIYEYAKAKGYFVLNQAGNPDTKWWNSKPNDAAYIDFTKPEARNWFSERVKRLQTEDGIDSFKFDAGETSWAPQNPVLQGDPNFSPNQITSDYVRLVSTFGPMVEIRSGQNTQVLPTFVRMLDKDSNWGWSNGLVTLITTLLQMNLNGYPFVLPDMIGGNGYNNIPPTKELFLRWLQANVFMPSMQFSYVPWFFEGDDSISISKKFVEMHSYYTSYIMKRLRHATKTGEPVNAPLWWIDPNDKVALSIYDQFTLGDDIIAAPVIQENVQVRDIYLPKGEWIDGNTKELIIGPIWLMEYSAPLDVLPFFIRKGSLDELDL